MARGEYNLLSLFPKRTEAQEKAAQRTFGLSAIGSVAGAVLWKDHRIWGFILGGMAGGGVGQLIFAPTTSCNLDETRQSLPSQTDAWRTDLTDLTHLDARWDSMSPTEREQALRKLQVLSR